MRDMAMRLMQCARAVAGSDDAIREGAVKRFYWRNGHEPASDDEIAMVAAQVDSLVQRRDECDGIDAELLTQRVAWLEKSARGGDLQAKLDFARWGTAGYGQGGHPDAAGRSAAPPRSGGRTVAECVGRRRLRSVGSSCAGPQRPEGRVRLDLPARSGRCGRRISKRFACAKKRRALLLRRCYLSWRRSMPPGSRPPSDRARRSMRAIAQVPAADRAALRGRADTIISMVWSRTSMGTCCCMPTLVRRRPQPRRTRSISRTGELSVIAARTNKSAMCRSRA